MIKSETTNYKWFIKLCRYRALPVSARSKVHVIIELDNALSGTLSSAHTSAALHE